MLHARVLRGCKVLTEVPQRSRPLRRALRLAAVEGGYALTFAGDTMFELADLRALVHDNRALADRVAQLEQAVAAHEAADDEATRAQPARIGAEP